MRIAGLATLALVAGCSPAEEAAPAGLALDPCRVPGIDRVAECGAVPVPERPGDPGGRSLPLRVVRLPARAAESAAAPLFLLAGGPGQAASEAFAPMLPALARIGRQRDLVMVDIRGTGASAPLDCDAPDSLAAELRANELARTARACRRALEPKADLQRYTTDVIADDLDRVRDALGYARIDLLGVSYGTRLAMIYARRHPQRARALVLDAVAPPWMAIPQSFARDAQAALDGLFRRCRAEAACAEAFPAVEQHLGELLASLPQRITVEHPSTGAPETFEIDRGGFAMGLRSLLYSPELSALVPFTIERAHAGDFGPFVAQLHTLAESANETTSLGLTLGVLCAEDVPRVEAATAEREASTSFLGTAALDELRAACAEWPRAPVDAAFARREPLEVPALLLSGELDPVTPPRWGEEALSVLPNGRHLTVPGMAHGVSIRGCVPELIAAFLTAPDRSLDAACLEDEAPPPLFIDGAGPPH